MLWFWRYLFGFVTIKINGECSERFINHAAACGVYIWNLFWRDSSIYGNISTKNFIKLFSIRHKYKCNIKIVKKYGLMNKTRLYKNRFGFYAGMVIFFVTLYFLTNFIWIININGNQNIPSKKIIKAYKQIGISEGVSKSKINSKYDAQRLQLSQNEIAWCSFNIEGCILNINLKETIVTEKEERQTPCNIKAAIDGKIKKINITSGSVNVKVGDVVSKGDLLVSGITENSKSTIFVHSSGEIIAETKREFSSEGNFTQTVTQETGECYNRYTVEILGCKIPLFLGNINKPNVYKSDSYNLRLFGNKIPIKIAKENYIITQAKDVTYTKEKLEKELLNDINNQVKEFDFISAEEIDRQIINTEKGILLKITYNCTENIALEDKILLSKEN